VVETYILVGMINGATLQQNDRIITIEVTKLVPKETMKWAEGRSI